LQAIAPVSARWAVASATIDDSRVVRHERVEQASPRIQRKLRFLVSRWKPEAWVALLASLASVTSYSYNVQQGLTLAYGDSISHLMIARRVFASNSPGLAQLGTVWLPLNHMLMLPLVWNDTLFRDGFAGTFPSMVAYVVSAVYLYRLATLVFSSPAAGWVAALALMLNPSVLYMQSTPMSELDLICFAIIAVYYVVRWARTFNADDLVKCALATAAGTLVRYDGWALAVTLLVVVGAVAWRLRGRLIAESHGLLFGALGLAGCVAWFIYQIVIFKNPFDFLYGPYSSRAQQQTTEATMSVPTHYDALLSLNVYMHAALDAVTWPIAVGALLGLLWWGYQTRLRVPTWPVYVVLVPFAFNWLSLFLGMTSIETPEVPLNGVATYFNVRYGMMMIPAAALFVAALTTMRVEWMPRLLPRVVVPLVFGLVILASSPLVAGATPYALQDPLYGETAAGRVLSSQEGRWLASNYQGGAILVSGGPFSVLMYDSHLPDSAFVTDGDGASFRAALAQPETAAAWIIMSPNGGNYDPVWVALHNRSDWRKHYLLRQVFGSTEIYQRSDMAYSPAPQSLARRQLAVLVGVPAATSALTCPALVGPRNWRLAIARGAR
jgi:hypothetical protein